MMGEIEMVAKTKKKSSSAKKKSSKAQDKKNSKKNIKINSKKNAKNNSKKNAKNNSKKKAVKTILKEPSKKKVSKKNLIKKMPASRINKVKDKIVGGDAAFYCFDGKVYYSLTELAGGLGEMCLDTFRFHVNQEKNDFYNWVKHIFQEDKLSAEIHKCKTPKSMKKVIEKQLI